MIEKEKRKKGKTKHRERILFIISPSATLCARSKSREEGETLHFIIRRMPEVSDVAVPARKVGGKRVPPATNFNRPSPKFEDALSEVPSVMENGGGANEEEAEAMIAAATAVAEGTGNTTTHSHHQSKAQVEVLLMGTSDSKAFRGKHGNFGKGQQSTAPSASGYHSGAHRKQVRVRVMIMIYDAVQTRRHRQQLLFLHHATMPR